MTIYVPDELVGEIRRRARKSHKSVSAYLVDLAAREVRPRAWPKSFLALYGSWEGKLVPPEDPPPEEPDAL